MKKGFQSKLNTKRYESELTCDLSSSQRCFSSFAPNSRPSSCIYHLMNNEGKMAEAQLSSATNRQQQLSF